MALATLLVAGLTAEIILFVSRKPVSGWIDAALLMLAAVHALSALSRQLPFQNVLFATVIIAGAAAAADGLNAQTDVPFGPVIFAEDGPALFRVPCLHLVLWIVVILNSRGVARLILRPWRKTKTYGFRLIGLTATLVAAFEFALEPYASRFRHYWFWPPTKLPLSWHSAPVSVFLGWAIVTILVLAFTTPLLINKQLSKSRGPDLHPLIAWLGAAGLFLGGTATAGLWSATAIDAVVAAVVATFAIRGAKW